MIKLTNILNELNINHPTTLPQLERWRDEIKATTDITTKLRLALKCAESVLFIFEKEHPNDPRPRNAINALRTYLNNPSEENWQKCNDASQAAADAAVVTINIATYHAAAAAYHAAAAAAYHAYANENSIYYAANRAINSFKAYNELN